MDEAFSGKFRDKDQKGRSWRGCKMLAIQLSDLKREITGLKFYLTEIEEYANTKVASGNWQEQRDRDNVSKFVLIGLLRFKEWQRLSRKLSWATSRIARQGLLTILLLRLPSLITWRPTMSHFTITDNQKKCLIRTHLRTRTVEETRHSELLEESELMEERCLSNMETITDFLINPIKSSKI